MCTVTVKQMQTIDRDAVRKLGIPSIVLMENAGRGVAEEILRDLHVGRDAFGTPRKGAPGGRALQKKNFRIVIVCGPGNNGGDGFVVARQLLIYNIRSKVFVLASKAMLKGDAAINCKIFQKMKGVVSFSAPSVAELKKADLIVDAIFGIGLSRKVCGVFEKVIEDINKCGKDVISLDVPSGLDADTGKIDGVCIKAKKTVTFHSAKKGMFRGQGPEHSGKVLVKHIGI